MMHCVAMPPSDSRSSLASIEAMDSDMARTDPMSGQMSMAPMMASVEFMLRPMEAMSIAAMSWQA